MSRGRKPLMALGEARLIAKKRGETRQFMNEPGMICSFVIFCTGFTAFVRIKRVTRVHCPHEWIEHEAADALAELRAIADGTGVSRELWVFLPRGSFRFFRVTATGLVELDRYGAVMPERAPPVAAMPIIPDRPVLPEPEPPTGPAATHPAPDAPEQEIPAQEAAAGPDPSSPGPAPPPGISVGEIPSEKGRGG